MGGRVAREVLWDKLLDNCICGLLFLILARAGAVLHAGLLLIQQAVLQGASIRAVTAAVVLLVKVCAIPFSFFMRQGRKHQKGVLFQMCVLMWLFCLSGCQGLAVPAGSRAEFNCTVENLQRSQWRVKKADGTVQAFAHGGVVYTGYTGKFSLDYHSGLSGNNTIYFQTLILMEATVDDDGQYRCEEEGDIITATDLTVETIPVLRLAINNTVTSTDIDVVLSQEVAVDCIAEGGKPLVTLSWWINGEEKSGHFIDNPPPSTERVTSTIHLLPTMEYEILTCVASGQTATPQTNVSAGLNVQYKPTCILGITNGTNAYVLTCSCSANPVVQTYKIYVNDSLFNQAMVATLPSEKGGTVFCHAKNDVGSFVTPPETLKPFHGIGPVQQQSKSSLIVGLCVTGIFVIGIFSLALGAIIWCHKRTKAAEKRADDNRDAAIDAAKIAQRKAQELSMQQTPEKVPMMEGNSEQVGD